MADVENLPYHRKYRPNTLAKYIGNQKLKETAMKALSSGKRPQVILLWGDSGCGKAQPLDSSVLTVSGFRKMGDICIGDEVYTHNGNIGKVSGIYPQGKRPIYRINLSDNTYIDVSDEHLNCIWGTDNSIKDEFEVVTTLDLIERLKTSLLYIRRDCSEFLNNKVNFTNRIVDSDLELVVRIDNIERLEDEECQCIMIDHPDHTYISDFLIPTHNTTFARLLAKEYSCEDRDDKKGACGQCMSCQTIDDYIATGDTSILTNIQEIDITDQSGKKDLDSVLADMEIPAFGDEWKIYIFDECHMASAGLQNRLLKIAEEPPENVLMLLCTTNPEKLIETLKNRCQIKLHVTKPKVKELAGLLRYVCECEGVEYDNDGLEFIANRGELTIRTALTNLQQVVTEQNAAIYDKAIQVFESVSKSVIINFFKALKSKDTFRYVTLLYEIKTKMDLNIFLSELKGFVQRGIYTINGIQVDGVSDGELLTYRTLFGDMGVAQISYLLNKLLSLNNKNLELELIMWGYTGLDVTNQVVDNQESVFESKIIEIEDELSKEESVTNKILKEKKEEEFNKGVENSKNLMLDVDIDDLIRGGGVLVD